jgi:diphosphomevalonate decarboxylase
MSAAACVAHPNIALSKYWGKKEDEGNVPAVPSLSVTLAGMSTRTMVRFRKELAADALTLNGNTASGAPLARVSELLDRVRGASGERRFAEVVSTNDFPTASGLASSASGFAACALAAVRAAGLDWDAARVSELARKSSASAARSIFGGFVKLDPSASLAARQVAPADHLDLRVVVAVTSEDAKKTGSTDGMKTTAAQSPYYAAWLEEAPRMHARLRAALVAKDFAHVGELAEASAMAMHACAIASGVVYWTGATLGALATVKTLRARGALVFATIDAGPHVKALVLGDTREVSSALAATPGVLRVIETRPGEGARVVEKENAS